MASKNTKAKAKTGLQTLTAHSITMKFHSELKSDESLNTLVDGKKLAKKHVFTYKTSVLKGFQYSETFTKFLDNRLAPYYKTKFIMISSRGGEELKTSLSTLSDGHSLRAWMKNNAPKLYLAPHEIEVGTIIKDRNYAEICGLGLFTLDATKRHMAYVSPEYTKQANKSIRKQKEMIGAIVDMDFKKSPIHAQEQNIETALLGLMSPEQFVAYKEAKKLEKAGTKQIASK